MAALGESFVGLGLVNVHTDMTTGSLQQIMVFEVQARDRARSLQNDKTVQAFAQENRNDQPPVAILLKPWVEVQVLVPVRMFFHLLQVDDPLPLTEKSNQSGIVTDWRDSRYRTSPGARWQIGVARMLPDPYDPPGTLHDLCYRANGRCANVLKTGFRQCRDES